MNLYSTFLILTADIILILLEIVKAHIHFFCIQTETHFLSTEKFEIQLFVYCCDATIMSVIIKTLMSNGEKQFYNQL